MVELKKVTWGDCETIRGEKVICGDWKLYMGRKMGMVYKVNGEIGELRDISDLAYGGLSVPQELSDYVCVSLCAPKDLCLYIRCRTHSNVKSTFWVFMGFYTMINFRQEWWNWSQTRNGNFDHRNKFFSTCTWVLIIENFYFLI